jgi:hypothetical protein
MFVKKEDAMGRTKVVGMGLAVVICLLLLPGRAAAQATTASGIARVVRDTSGGVLPGVTVEAASPALIEKVRTAVSDGDGRYNITDLRPGTYAVTFTLAGFSVFVRDGIVLSACSRRRSTPTCALEQLRRRLRSLASRRWWTRRAPAARRWSRASCSACFRAV